MGVCLPNTVCSSVKSVIHKHEVCNQLAFNSQSTSTGVGVFSSFPSLDGVPSELTPIGGSALVTYALYRAIVRIDLTSGSDSVT